MATEEKPIEGKAGENKPGGDQTKVVPLGDLIALKKGFTSREKDLKAQLVDSAKRISELEQELELSQVGENDEEVSEVKKQLLIENKKLQKSKSDLDKSWTSFQEREKKVRAKELALQYSIDVKDLEGEEDIETAVLRLYADRLAEENKKLKEKAPEQEKEPEIFETGKRVTGGIKIANINVKTPEGRKALAEIEKDLIEKTLSK